MATYFISDLHLSKNTPEIAQIFKTFLSEHLSDADALYILGDLFEYWVGDDAISSFHHEIANWLKKTSEKVPIFFLSGNRDFLLGSKYAKQAGMQLLPEPYVLELHGQRILLLHGDRQCLNDPKHLKFREWTDKIWLRKLFLALPRWIRHRIAQRMRSHRMHDDSFIDAKYDLPKEEILRLLGRYECEILIHGHTHWPGIQVMFNTNRNIPFRYTLSDWGLLANHLKINREKQIFLNNNY